MSRFKLSLVLPLFTSSIMTVDAFWRMSCSVIQTGRIDPVVSYNSPSSHVHKISGGANININSTYASLRQSPCTSCSIQADLSAYWTPQLYYAHTDGTYEEVQNGGMAIYYLGRGVGNDGSSAIPFPEGLQMLSGNTTARTYDSNTMTWGNKTYPPRPVSDRVSFVCIGGNVPDSANITSTNCPDGFRAQIQMQSCWDGKNLASHDQSHVAYLSQIDNGACPPTHPHLLPHLFYEVLYSTNSIDQSKGGYFIFANGDTTGYGFHGDFLNGWDTPTLKAGIDQCLVANQDGVVENCKPFQATNNDNFADICKERSPVYPCEQVHGTISSPLPGCSSPSKGITSCPGGPASCAANYNTYGPRVYSGSSQFTPLGCYTDQGGSRTLTGKSFGGNKTLTAEGCLQYCSGYKYAGMEYGQECYCGNTIASTGTVANSSDCSTGCSGDRLELCGGSSRINLYQAVGSNSSPAASTVTSASTVTKATATSASLTMTSSAASTPSTARIFPGDNNFTYYACVKDVVNARALPTKLDTPQTVEGCLSAAALGAYSWAGIEYGGECWVGSLASLNQTSSPNATANACQMTCKSAPNEICGGPNLLTMYQRTAPLPPQPSVYSGKSENSTYLGCYVDPNGNRTLTASPRPLIESDNMSVEYCLKSARAKGYSYAGLEYSRECWAGNEVNPLSMNATDQTTCNMPCSGSKLELCGGPNRLNLYELS